MALKPGDIVRYIAGHHEMSDNDLGRICKPFGATMFWVHFGDIGCVPVRATSLKKATGNAPNCNGCP